MVLKLEIPILQIPKRDDEINQISKSAARCKNLDNAVSAARRIHKYLLPHVLRLCIEFM